MNEHAFEKLGGKPRVKKPEHKIGGASVTQIPPIHIQPSAFTKPIYYQGKRPACGAHAGAWYGVYKQNGNAPGDTPQFTWVDIKENGEDKNPSDGCTMPDIFKSVTETGLDQYEPLGNDVQLDDAAYASPSSITNAMKQYAAQHKLSGEPYYVDNPSFEELKKLIYEHGSVIVLMRVGDTMWTDAQGNVTWNPEKILPLRVPSQPVDGHFVVAHGYTENYIYFANSWSTRWGIDGHGYFGQDYMPLVLEVGYLA